MVLGGLIGYFAPSVASSLKSAEVGDVSIPIGVLLWLMIFPMLLQIDFVSLKRVAIVPGPVLLTR
jgi:ACR3 family arsenite transporter